ncbi:MAG: CsbD family protein [Terracidiphilus sp.]|jgi:uncharacterized protein YjbJ (UPF0337 family)
MDKQRVKGAIDNVVGGAKRHVGNLTGDTRTQVEGVAQQIKTELFGDYTPETMLIRVWMRTAVRKEITSFGTFLSTLCHEFCHHLDDQKFNFADSWHTRGFYERVAVLYHHAKGTPLKKLFWVPTSGGRWRIDWPRTNRSA